MFHGIIQGKQIVTHRLPQLSFAEELAHPGMLQMLRYWVACRRARNGAMPARPDFDPMRLPRLLPFLQLHERKPDGRYLCRVSGTAVVEAYGFESTNRYVGDVIDSAHLQSRIAILDEALRTGLPIYYEGRLVLAGRDWQGCNRLILPLADAQGWPRFIISLLDFSHSPPQDRPIPGLEDADRHGIASKRSATEADLAAL